jgi:hypothetical protein
MVVIMKPSDHEIEVDMKKPQMLVGIVVLVVVGCSTVVLCQEPGVEWRRLMEEADTLAKVGKYERGIVVAQQALELAERERGPEHPEVARSLNQLAWFYSMQGNYAKAEPLFQR